MKPIPAGNEDVEIDESGHIRPGDTQWRIEAGNKVGQLAKGYELSSVGIEARPLGIEALKILLAETQLLFVVGLVEVLQQDGDVHVDDDHRRKDDERDKVESGQHGTATVAVRQIVVLHVAIRRLNQ